MRDHGWLLVGYASYVLSASEAAHSLRNSVTACCHGTLVRDGQRRNPKSKWQTWGAFPAIGTLTLDAAPRELKDVMAITAHPGGVPIVRI